MCSRSLLIVGLLVFFAGLIHSADAARPAHLRAPSQVVLPPLLGGGVSSGKGSRDLGERVFKLRHIYHHGTHKYPDLHRYTDIEPEAKLRVTYDDGRTIEDAPNELRAQAVTTNIQRLVARNKTDIDDLLAESAWYGRAADLPASAWTSDEIAGPNISDKSTVITFAKMAANAYVQTRLDGAWLPVKGGFNYTDDFGWQTDGLRGHIFADESNSTVVIGLKGTSPAIFDGADTTGNDKLNDNLFGSCCCGQGGQYLWKQVCDCMTGTYQCNSTCLVKSLQTKSHYYWAVRDLYHNVTERYPNSDVWLSGHSLGGVVSSLLGLTYGLPTMTFEAFPDAMAASRLGLPTPPGYQIGSHQSRSDVQLHHFGHTADPIYMGTCNAASSFCTIAGYAFQGVCHTGKTCTYDTVGDLGWRVGIGTHKIVNVIKDVLEKYDTVPTCEADEECVDCYNWKFYESNGTESTTTSSSSSTSTTTRTRTETCKTPGWFGCLDESTTTTTTTSTSSTSSTSTSTCHTPGWFGCKDESTTTSAATITTTSAAPGSTTTVITTTSKSTSTCTPGFFWGCDDEPSTTTSATPKPSRTSSHASSTTSAPDDKDDCTSREFFGLICVDPSPPTTNLVTPSPTRLPTTKRKHCVGRHWYGSCKEWRWEDTLDPKWDLL
ncbi:putative lipase [Sphaerulina musiva]